MGLQALMHMAHPPQCITCGARVTSDFGLCGDCWRDTPFVTGLVCNHCGIPLPGEEVDAPVLCDDCLSTARPWRAGRAAPLYYENGRKLVLALKHADRLDLAPLAAEWMLKAAQPLLSSDMLVAPVPLHWWRLVQRRYNQAAVCRAASQNSRKWRTAPTCCNAPTTPDRKRGAPARDALPTCRAR